MMRLAAAVFVFVMAGFPMAVMPGPPVTWLAGVALVAAGAGVLVLSVTLVTVGGSIALIAYAVALLIVRSPIDPVAAGGFGATLVLVLALVHFAGRVDGAVLGPAVVATQARHWLAIVATGVGGGGGVTVGAKELRAALTGKKFHLVGFSAAIGALLAVGGVIALTTREEPPPPS